MREQVNRTRTTDEMVALLQDYRQELASLGPAVFEADAGQMAERSVASS